MPQRIGILGGAFDPPHNAHVAMAEAAIAQFKLDALRVIPTGDAWHKPRKLSSGVHRAEMARLAFGHLSKVRIDEIELLRQGPSYTIDTLRALSKQAPEAQFFLLIGEDQGKALATWREIEEIAQRAIICVAERDLPGMSVLDVPNHDIPTQVLKLPHLPHSATQVREWVAQGQAIDHLVPKPVALYIQRHHLYLPDR
ncbi:MAG: nicotinate (nicotinamide) nucleotide adenylyltransferase [Burkholderiales bacterium]|nr:nicotinate (nicotinamide) nucleotide adenylyltransferase [Burkholderiales bacterium]